MKKSKIPIDETVRAFSTGFYQNSKHALKALDNLGWCDTFYCEQKKGDVGGMPGTVENLLKLNIDYSKYNVCLTFNDWLFDSLELLLKNCMRNNITIVGNQHGYDKSVLFIKNYTPNPYAKYWNTMGDYWLDRYKTCVGKPPITNRWLSIGSLKADYLYKNYRWDKNKTNHKVLVLHEPDTDLADFDPIPLKPTEKTKRIIEILKSLNIDFDFKLHPSWSEFIANKDRIQMWKPSDCNFVNIDLPQMKDYDLVIGCYSTTLLEAAAMNIPVVNIKFDYPTDKGSHWGPGELSIFPLYDVEDLPELIYKHLGQPMNYDMNKLKYFLGPLGKTSEIYHDFLRDDLIEPKKFLGPYYNKWERKRTFRLLKDIKIIKIIIYEVQRINNFFIRGLKKIIEIVVNLYFSRDSE